MLQLVSQIGWPLWPLIAASVIGLALLLERLFVLRRSRIMPARLLRQVMPLAQSGASEDTLKAMAADSPLGRLLAEVLRAPSRQSALERTESLGAVVASSLSRNISMIGSIGSVAPLLGLFGTVIGMIEIFAAHRTGADPAELAHGISVALYCTAFGILVAVPALIAHRALRRCVEGMMAEMADQASQLLEARFACRDGNR